MKKALQGIVIVGIFLFVNLCTNAFASVAFYAVNFNDTDDVVQIAVSNFASSTDYTLEYRYADLSWADWASGTTKDILMTTGNREAVYLRLNDNGTFINSADLTFNGEGPEGLFSTLIADWHTSDIFNFSVVSPTYCDKLAPVPISSAALLFGSGLIGLVGIRRKIRK